jgi:hypothetical protein
MWAVLIDALVRVVQWALPRILSVVGVVTISATVYTPLLNWLNSKINSSLSGLTSDAYGFLQFVGIPSAISIIFAAITLQIGIKTAKAAYAKKGATDA